MGWTTFFNNETPIELHNVHGDPLFFELKHQSGEVNCLTHPDNTNGYIGFVNLEGKMGKGLLIKHKTEPVSHYFKNQLHALLPNYEFEIREVLLEDIIAPFIKDIEENYTSNTMCYIQGGQIIVMTNVDHDGQIGFTFKTNMTMDKISPSILRAKIKKWGADDRNMRMFVQSPGVIQCFKEFISFSKKNLNLTISSRLTRSNYSGFKSFMKQLKFPELEAYLSELKDSDKPKDHYDILQTAAGSLKKRIYNYCGLNITPYAKPHDPYVQLIGNRLNINRSNFYVIEALLKMVGKYDAFETDIERMKLLYC